MTTEKTCDWQGCGKTFVIKPTSPFQKFCSDKCSAKARRLKTREMLHGTPEVKTKKDDDDEVVKRSTIATPINATTDILTKTILDFKEKEISRMEAAYNEERSKRKKLKAECETLRAELAQIKTDQRIAEIENQKPSGLNGILPGGIEGLLNNPHVGPVIGGLLQRILSPAAGALGGADSPANGFILWFDQQADDVKQGFAELVDGLSKTEPANLAETIKRMVALLNVGTTMGNPGEFKQTAAYGYN